MLNRNINSIIYQSYIKLGELTYDIAKKSEEGFSGTKALNALWQKAINIDNLIFTIVENAEVVDNEVYRIVGVSDSDVNKMLACLESISGIKDYPIAPFLVSRDVTKLSIAGEGTSGSPGTNGVSSYMAVVFAADAIGTDMSTSPAPFRPYIAFKTSTSLIPITPSTFTGLWVRYIGTDGTQGLPGEDGDSYYFYIRYASDTAGSNYSATPAQSRKYVGYLVSTTDLLNNPPSSMFAGLWMKYIGDDGANGQDGEDGNTILCVSGAPDNAIGSDGDVAIDITGWYIHAPKSAGVWPPGVSIIGPAGATGSAGVDGNNGTNGQDAYLYIAWADDAAGAGFTLIFDPNKNWIATISTNTEIPTPTVSDFTGRWAKYRGDGDKWATYSSSNVTIGTGTKALVIGAGLAYTTGQKIVIALDNDPTNRMEGLVIGYNQVTGQFTVSITEAFGSGSYSSWDVNLQGAPTVAPTTDSYFAEIYVESGEGTQDVTGTATKLDQFTVNGSFNNGMIPDFGNGRITSSVAGQFAIYANLTLGSVLGGMFILQLYKNGLPVDGSRAQVIIAVNEPIQVSLKTIRPVMANDEWEVWILTGEVGTVDVILLDGTFGMYTTGTPSTPEYSQFGGEDFDTGIDVIIDSFPAALGDAIIWEYKIKKGNNLKTGRIQGAWDSLGNITENDEGPAALGTIDVTLGVDIDAGNVRLKATLTSDDWEISGNRYILV